MSLSQEQRHDEVEKAVASLRLDALHPSRAALRDAERHI